MARDCCGASIPFAGSIALGLRVLVGFGWEVIKEMGDAGPGAAGIAR